MDRDVTEQAIKIYLAEMSSRLNEAARIAKAAEACAQAGSVDEGVSVAMDIEQLVYEAGRLHDAASLLNRLSQGTQRMIHRSVSVRWTMRIHKLRARSDAKSDSTSRVKPEGMLLLIAL